MTTQAGTVPATGPVALFVETVALCGRRLRRLRRSPGRLVGMVMNPLVMLVAVGYLFEGALVSPGTGSYIDYLMAGVVLQVGLAGIGPTAISASMDVHGGLMDRFRSLPISRAAVLAGHAISDTVAGIAGLLAVTGVGLVLGWRPHAGALDVAAGFGVVIVFIHVMAWVGILIGLLVRSVESIDSIGALVVVLFTFLSNVVFPTSAMPGWLRPVVDWNPVSAVATVIRRLWGAPGQDVPGFAGDHASAVLMITVGALLLATSWLSVRRLRAAD
ncbi:ABC transporter permease [Micromonospora sp. NPDC049044]|uniref:ABC transporter permease n=1 Tax=unclassified Micromonospora TaxID=2617518 RepID=UPI0033F6EC09